MSAINREQVGHLAELARIEMSDEELARVAGELDLIVESVVHLEEIVLYNVPLSASPPVECELPDSDWEDQAAASVSYEALVTVLEALDSQDNKIPRLRLLHELEESPDAVVYEAMVIDGLRPLVDELVVERCRRPDLYYELR